MSWNLQQLDAWLDEVEPIADERTLFDWLEIPPTAGSQAIQDAYHKVARSRHPDLFRTRLKPDELDRLVRMYARVTSAYAELRDPEKCAAYLRKLKAPAPPPSAAGPSRPRPPTPGPRIEPSHNMNARALAFYRRAEGALRTGDRGAATLQLKMAIAADPQSTFLRAALAELMGGAPK